MSKTDCQYADWEQLGYQVAMEGNQDINGAFNKRAEICSKHGFSADLELFRAGHVRGTEDFCEVDHGVKMGVKARGVALQICPEGEYPGYAAAFDAGYRLHEMRREEAAARAELERLENAEYRSRQQIGQIRSNLRNEGLSDEQRRQAERRIRYLRRDVNNLRYDIDYVRARYYRASQAAQTYAEMLELEYPDL